MKPFTLTMTNVFSRAKRAALLPSPTQVPRALSGVRLLLRGRANRTELVARNDDRGVSAFLWLYVLVCLAVAFGICAKARGDDETVYKGKPASYWAGEVKADVPRWREALNQLGPEAKDCVPAIIEVFRGESLQPVQGGSCNPP